MNFRFGQSRKQTHTNEIVVKAHSFHSAYSLNFHVKLISLIL